MRTPLADLQANAGARFVDFAGWELPVHYGSQIDEHHAVRNESGCFDVSHMAVVDIKADHAESFLQRLLTSDVARLQAGEGFYTLMLTSQAGIVDDLIVYRRANNDFRLVVNAGTSEKDLAWMRNVEREVAANSGISHRRDLCIVAVQGPNAVQEVVDLLNLQAVYDLPKFSYKDHDDMFIARTGYTGEDGVEVICPVETARKFWAGLMERGVQPAGLGARDSLRLEAGLNLYGHDMTENTTPFESRLAWTIDEKNSDRIFVGRESVTRIRESGSTLKLTGVRMIEKGIPREEYTVRTQSGDGVITSGSFSPTLGCGIALARVPSAARGECEVVIRKKSLPAKLVRPPFVKKKS